MNYTDLKTCLKKLDCVVKYIKIKNGNTTKNIIT